MILTQNTWKLRQQVAEHVAAARAAGAAEVAGNTGDGHAAQAHLSASRRQRDLLLRLISDAPVVGVEQ